MGLPDLIQPRIAELGKIKVGGLGESRPKRDGGTFRLPVKYDHFVVTTLHRNAAGDLIEDMTLMERLKEEYADQDGHLRQLPIAVLSNEIEDIIQASYVWYVGKKCAARSDGIKLTKFYDGKVWLKQPQVIDWKPEHADLKDAKGNRYFKLHSVFSCIISSKEAKWGGLYKFRTTSRITASQLYGSLLHLKELTGGVLRGLPLRLAVRPMQVAPEGKVTTVYVVHVELVGPDLTAIQHLALERMKCELANARQLDAARREYRRLLLPPGEKESPVEQADVAEEFQPETQEAEAPTVHDPLAAELGLTLDASDNGAPEATGAPDLDNPGREPGDEPAQPDDHDADLRRDDICATIRQDIREATTDADLDRPRKMIAEQTLFLGDRAKVLQEELKAREGQLKGTKPRAAKTTARR